MVPDGAAGAFLFCFAFLLLKVRNCSDTQPRVGRRRSRSGNSSRESGESEVVEGQDVQRN